MALISCHECKSKISDTASNCLKCGAPLKKKFKDMRYRDQVMATYKGCWIIVLIIIVFIFIIAWQ